jgi:small-conductance mechanosensitive channel
VSTLVEYTFAGNPLTLWATALVTLVVIVALIAALRSLLKRRFQKAHETTTEVDDLMYEVISGTKLFFLFFPAVFLAARVLTLAPEVRSLVRGAAVIALLAQVGIWLSGLVEWWIARHKRTRLAEDPGSATALSAAGFVIRMVLWSVVLLIALENLGFDITTLVAGLGIGGVAVALATQNILGDLFASLSIVVDKPFVIGDFIVVGDFAGTVEHVGLKTTRVKSISGEQLVFSNSDLLQSRIRNFRLLNERRIVVVVPVSIATSADALQKIPLFIRTAIEKHQNARFDRAHFLRIREWSYDFEYVYFVLDPQYAVYMEIQQAINLDLVRAFAAENISFADPSALLLRGSENPSLRKSV